MDRAQFALLALVLLAAPALSGCLGDQDQPQTDTAEDPGSGSGSQAGEAGGDGASSDDETLEWKTVERTVVAKDIVPHQPPRNYTYDVEGSEDKVVEVPENSTVELTMVSHEQNALDHDIRIEGQGVQTDTIGPGESLTVSFNVTEPGPSPFWCTIGDHRERGMEGVLVVQDR